MTRDCIRVTLGLDFVCLYFVLYHLLHQVPVLATVMVWWTMMRLEWIVVLCMLVGPVLPVIAVPVAIIMGWSTMGRLKWIVVVAVVRHVPVVPLLAIVMEWSTMGNRV